VSSIKIAAGQILHTYVGEGDKVSFVNKTFVICCFVCAEFCKLMMSE